MSEQCIAQAIEDPKRPIEKGTKWRQRMKHVAFLLALAAGIYLFGYVGAMFGN